MRGSGKPRAGLQLSESATAELARILGSHPSDPGSSLGGRWQQACLAVFGARAPSRSRVCDPLAWQSHLRCARLRCKLYVCGHIYDYEIATAD